MNMSPYRFLRKKPMACHLVLLFELGRHRSIHGAVGAAGLTQPAAARLLGKLEDTLGLALFERSPRGVEPTAHGGIMIRRASAAQAEMELVLQEIMQGASADGTRVSRYRLDAISRSGARGSATS